MIEYIAPAYALTIGDIEVLQLSSIDIYSSRINPIDCAEISIDAVGFPSHLIKTGQPVEAWLGYREKGLWKVFGGTVVDVGSKRALTVKCKDAMETLRAMTITKTFVDIRPQDIVKYLLTMAGVNESNICKTTQVPKHTFVSAAKTGIELIKLVNRSWNLDWDFYFEPEGAFYWGPWKESDRYQDGEEIVTFEYGVNILDLKPSTDDTGMLTTIMLPFLRHSELIRINDGRFWGREVTARIERIRHHYSTKGRTEIEWTIVGN
jgi:hypothetical protein